LVTQPKTVSRLPDAEEKEYWLSVAWRERHLRGLPASTDNIAGDKSA
jgi:hypothetical protein